MSTTVGSSTSPRPAPAVAQPQPANLDAEKAKCERQLADWVHCVSATTPAGKAKIAELSAQLSQINTQIQRADDDGSTRTPPSLAATTDASAAPARRPASALSTLGSVVDVHA